MVVLERNEASGKFFYSVKGPNGKELIRSKPYPNRRDLDRAVNSFLESVGEGLVDKIPAERKTRGL